jgi:hypothetical protein
MIELTQNADLALKKIHGLRRLNLKPTVLQKAEQKVLQNLNLEDLAIVAAVLAEETKQTEVLRG